MTSSPRLAAAQTVPVAGDVDANLTQHLQLIERAAAEGVTLLVFPELSLTGYELALGPALAFATEDERLGPLLAAARRHHMTLVVGAPVRTSVGLHIGAFIISSTRSTRLYTKHHLGAFQPEDCTEAPVPPSEATFFSPGSANPMTTWEGRALALSICADSAYPSHTDAAARRGAALYASSQCAIPVHMAFKMSRLKQAARKHGFTVIFSNYGGPTGGLPSAGASCIRSPTGHTVASLPARGCGLAMAWPDANSWTGKSVLVNEGS